MAATLDEFITALQQFPPDTDFTEVRMMAVTRGGDAYDLNLCIRIVGAGMTKNSLAIIVAHSEELEEKIPGMVKL